MIRLSHRLCVAALGLWLAVSLLCSAQTTAASTNPASATAPTAKTPTPIAVGDVVTEAQSAADKMKSYQAPDTIAQSVRADLDEAKAAIDKRLAADQRFEQAVPTLGSLQNSQTAWQNISTSLAGLQSQLYGRVTTQTAQLADLMSMKATWTATLQNPSTAKAPPATVQTVQETQVQIGDTTAAVNADLRDLYDLQRAVAEQDDRVKTGLDSISKEIASAQARLFEQGQPSLWNPAAFSVHGQNVIMSEKLSLGQQVDSLESYLGVRVGAMLIQAFLLAMLIAGCYWLRNITREKAKTEPGLRDAERVFDAPLATALLLALVACHWLYPSDEAPRLLWSIICAIALVPTVLIVRRLISADLMTLLYATVAAFFLDQVRYAATPSGVVARMIFLAELLGVCIFILVALRSKQLCVSSADPTRVEKIVRAYLHTAFFVFLAAGFANVLGYVPLSFVIGDGMLWSSYLAVIFYAAVRIVDALALASMSLRPIRSFGMVRCHHDLVYQKVSTVIRWVASAVWAVAALQTFYLRDPLWQSASDVLSAKHSFFSIKDIELGSILAFPITVWAAFAISNVLRFVLQEDVYPNLNLPRGIPYAISTMIHYAILVAGFFMALSAMGIDLSSYAVLAGAFGVGLGFGLQNIMNNFISGLILLFERPIKVGDTVQIDANTIGRVERIGIRASVILLTNGSELIMPNGNLISNPVTNWTLSNCERLVEIPLSLAAKGNVKRALELMIDAAKANSAALKNPSPQAIIVAIGAASTSVKLRCWIDAEEDWLRVMSDLSLAIQAALEKENIALA